MGSFGAFLIEKPSHRLEIRCHVVRSRISIGVSRIRDGGQNDNESGLEVHPCFVVPSLEVVSILVFFAFILAYSNYENLKSERQHGRPPQGFINPGIVVSKNIKEVTEMIDVKN
ncbi:hypothetical protein Tco_0072482 [Tanacetum coccineum]